LDDPFETAVVDSREERDSPAVLLFAQHRDGAGLRQRFDDEHTGHDRAAGEVAREIPLVLAHALARDSADARRELEHLVDQEEGLTVREDLLDLRASEWEGDGHATSSSSPRSFFLPRWA